jgi:hypothetical protein
MHPNEELITKFYTAFAAKDHATMAQAYAADVHFQDPVFTLDGFEAGAMWQMLCSRAGDALTVEFSGVEADDTQGKAHWEAWYPFGPGKRPVHNCIDATFTFKDGLITAHTDVFSFFTWSKMALGPLGYALGWTPILPMIVRHTAGKDLRKYIAKHNLGPTAS